MVSVKAYRDWYLRRHKMYEGIVMGELIRHVRGTLKNLPLITPATYEQVIAGSLTDEALTDVYKRFYTQIGILHGEAINEGINTNSLSVKAGLPEFLGSTLFSEAWARFMSSVFTQGLAGTKIVTVNKNLISTVLSLIKKGINNGFSYKQMVDTLTDRFGDANTTAADGSQVEYGRYQMERIARTETNTAANWAAYVQMEQSPYVMDKVWITAEDKRVRDGNTNKEFNHVAMHTRAVAVEQLFAVPQNNGNGNSVLFPGDQTNGAAGNVINCRCSIAPRVKRHRNGLPVRKDGTNNPARFGGTLTEQEIAELRAFVNGA